MSLHIKAKTIGRLIHEHFNKKNDDSRNLIVTAERKGDGGIYDVSVEDSAKGVTSDFRIRFDGDGEIVTITHEKRDIFPEVQSILIKRKAA